MKGPYRDYSISCVEREIISLYKERQHMHDDRKHAYCLLSLRKKMLDYWARNHLTEHTNLALTDFIYVRDFEKSIVVIREEEKSYLS